MNTIYCVVGITLLISSIYMSLQRDRSHFKNFENLLNREQTEKYKKIIKERIYIYIGGLLLGFVEEKEGFLGLEGNEAFTLDNSSNLSKFNSLKIQKNIKDDLALSANQYRFFEIFIAKECCIIWIRSPFLVLNITHT